MLHQGLRGVPVRCNGLLDGQLPRVWPWCRRSRLPNALQTFPAGPNLVPNPLLAASINTSTIMLGLPVAWEAPIHKCLKICAARSIWLPTLGNKTIRKHPASLAHVPDIHDARAVWPIQRPAGVCLVLMNAVFIKSAGRYAPTFRMLDTVRRSHLVAIDRLALAAPQHQEHRKREGSGVHYGAWRCDGRVNIVVAVIITPGGT